MLEEPKANAWETLGYSWHCQSCGDRTAGTLWDYAIMYAGAQAHAQEWPTHRVYLDREQSRWVIPQSVKGAEP